MESEAEVLLQNDHYDSDADSVTNELDDSATSVDKNSEDKLINSYEEALSLTNIDIAQIIARSTCINKENSCGAPASRLPKKDKQQPKPSTKKSKSKKKKKWEVGAHCRAIYSQDGLEYEAIVSKVVSFNERVVTFVGYNNSQVVETCLLKPSLGLEVQAQQILEADEIGVDEYPGDNDNENELIDIPRKKPRPKSSNRRKKHRTQKCGSDHEYTAHSMPFMPQMPGLSSKLKLPFMPPIPPSQFSEPDEHLSSMLLSWFMSGYYTGLYQGTKCNSSTNNRKH